MTPASYRPHYPIERCARPRYRSASLWPEALIMLAALVIYGAGCWLLAVV
jgi:hypothetical protein